MKVSIRRLIAFEFEPFANGKMVLVSRPIFILKLLNRICDENFVLVLSKILCFYNISVVFRDDMNWE